MHAIKKKVCSRAYAGIEELEGFARRAILRHHSFMSSTADLLVTDSRRTAHAGVRSGVSFVKWNDSGAVARVPGTVSRLPMGKLVRIEGLQIGGLRKMGVTTRPSDRAAEHGVRNPLPFGENSPEKNEERRQDEFLRAARRAAASKVKDVEEAVGERVGASFEPTDAEVRGDLGRQSADLVHEEASEFTVRSESHSSGTQSAAADKHGDDGNLHHGIDEEVHRGLLADSEFPVGRLAGQKDELEDDEGLVTGTLSDDDLAHTHSPKDGKNKYSAV
ncbi:hypothetical protein R1sor_001323 [Riccia sorocarpa]|uniref:Uncharacterized protein n=1 Tax=Riccia sorocarpa TaxID=122646 RepID=A0ABD3GXA0_9MARC